MNSKVTIYSITVLIIFLVVFGSLLYIDLGNPFTPPTPSYKTVKALYLKDGMTETVYLVAVTTNRDDTWRVYHTDRVIWGKLKEGKSYKFGIRGRYILSVEPGRIK